MTMGNLLTSLLFEEPSPSSITHHYSSAVKEKIKIDDPDAITFFQELGLPPTFTDDGKFQAWKLQPTDPDYARIYTYVENSQELAFGVKILNIMKINPCAHESIIDFKDNPQLVGKHRKMLFHGTRAENIYGILEKGLRLPQNDTAGLYFADRVAKGCFYTDEGHSKDLDGKQGYVFLCDVLLGKMNTGHVTHNSRAAPPIKIFNRFGLKYLIPCESVMVRAVRVPDPKGNVVVDGCEWPLGLTVNNWNFFYQFNEFIVYDGQQVQPKFLLKVEFTEEPYYHSQ